MIPRNDFSCFVVRRKSATGGSSCDDRFLLRIHFDQHEQATTSYDRELKSFGCHFSVICNERGEKLGAVTKAPHHE